MLVSHAPENLIVKVYRLLALLFFALARHFTRQNYVCYIDFLPALLDERACLCRLLLQAARELILLYIAQ